MYTVEFSFNGATCPILSPTGGGWKSKATAIAQAKRHAKLVTSPAGSWAMIFIRDATGALVSSIAC